MVSNRARTLDVGVVKQEVGVAAEKEIFFSQVQIVANQFMSAKKVGVAEPEVGVASEKTRNTVLFTLKIYLYFSLSLSLSHSLSLALFLS